MIKNTDTAKPVYIKDIIKNKIIDKDYDFGASEFEISNSNAIPEDKLNFSTLEVYLEDTYGACNKPHYQRNTIKNIFYPLDAEKVINSNTSEYFKVLTHFTVLSIFKRGWFNLLVTTTIRTSPPSLSDFPSQNPKEDKKINDASIRCYYHRLFEGMTQQDKDKYKLLTPRDEFPAVFDFLLFKLDDSIQKLFCFFQQVLSDNYEDTLPDVDLDKHISMLNDVIDVNFITQNEHEDYSVDTLRASLIKFASLNSAINSIDANINIQNEVLKNLPENIEDLKYINTELEILPAILNIFNIQESQLPIDLIECSKLVCQIYIISSTPSIITENTLSEYNEIHSSPSAIAVSAALLFHNHLHKNKLNSGVRGSTNKNIHIYKTLSDFSKVLGTNTLTAEILLQRGFPEILFKYLTNQYSVSMFGLSDFYPSHIGAAAHMRVKKAKFELQNEVYVKLKKISINQAIEVIKNLIEYADILITTTRVINNSLNNPS